MRIDAAFVYETADGLNSIESFPPREHAKRVHTRTDQ